MKKILFTCAAGNEYSRIGKLMLASFAKYNPDWETRLVTESDIVHDLPVPFRHQNPFFKCEIGRWMFLLKLLYQYDLVVYSDSDMYWYDAYNPLGRGLVLSHHYLLESERFAHKYQLIKDGVPNLGLIEASKTNVVANLINTFIQEIFRHTGRYFHGSKLWLQTVASCLPGINEACCFHNDPGLNVAMWNFMSDRKLIYENNKFFVKFKDNPYPLRSFHFSKVEARTDMFVSDAAKKLLADYLAIIK